MASGIVRGRVGKKAVAAAAAAELPEMAVMLQPIG